MIDILLIILTGALTGLSSGMFGIGGSVVATPMLIVLVGVPFMIAFATPLPAALPSAISGSVLYGSKRLIRYKIAAQVLIFAIPANIVGAYLTNYVNPTVLINFKAMLLFALGLKLLISKFIFKESIKKVKSDLLTCGITGIATGFISGFFAIGGGILMVPLFLRLHNLKIKSSIATSLFSVGFLALIGSVGHFINGNINFKITLILAITVIPFSYLGAKLSTMLKEAVLEKLFGWFLMLFAIYFIINNIV